MSKILKNALYSKVDILPIKASEITVLRFLVGMTEAGSKTYRAKIDTFAKKIKPSRRSVQYAIASLKEEGFIDYVEGGKKGKKYDPHVYELHPEKILGEREFRELVEAEAAAKKRAPGEKVKYAKRVLVNAGFDPRGLEKLSVELEVRKLVHTATVMSDSDLKKFKLLRKADQIAA